MVLRLFPHFNPRSLTGATIICFYKSAVSRISIHAPSRERRRFMRKVILMMIFQSTLPRGSDSWVIAKFGTDANFNPRSLAGATFRSCTLQGLYLFQSTLPRGSDQIPFYHHHFLGNISIHAPSRERLRKA